MEKIPEYTVVEEMRKTHKAFKKLSPEDRITIQTHALESLLNLLVQTTVTPETVAAAAHELQEHPELIKPLERLEQLVEAEK